MKDLLRDQEKETGKETKVKSTQVIFFHRAFQYKALAKKNRQVWDTDHCVLQHREKDFRIKKHLAIFCDEGWLLCLDGLH